MNALIQLQGAGTQLTEVEQMILDEINQDANAFDLQPERVKIAPGGIGQFLAGEGETVKTFTAIVAISQKIRGYWPGSGTGNAPLCSSPDGARGIFTTDPDADQIKDATTAKQPHPAILLYDAGQPVPDFFGCVSCPLNQWGSEHQRRGGEGRGKACKEMRRLLLLIDGWALPALMSLPPTSIKAWDGFCSGQASRKSAYFAVRTKFELDAAKANGGETYNVVKVSQVDRLTDTADMAAVSEIRRQYRDLVSQMPIQVDEYETIEPGADDDLAPF